MANFKNYVLGRGRLYFDRFDANEASTGLRYLGNTPAMSVTKETQTLDHYDSDEGVRNKDKSVDIQVDQRITFTTDNIEPANVALWWGADLSDSAIASATNTSETIASATLGMSYQLGITGPRPEGASNITGVEVVIGSDTIDAAGNYTVDELGGILTILPDAADIEAADEIVVTYDTTAYADSKRMIYAASVLYGKLVFVTDNPVGPNMKYVFPYCKISSNGDAQLKGDEWQQLSFTAEVLTQDAETERFILRTTPANA